MNSTHLTEFEASRRNLLGAAFALSLSAFPELALAALPSPDRISPERTPVAIPGPGDRMVFSGRVCDLQGCAQAGLSIDFRYEGGPSLTVQTDADGRFMLETLVASGALTWQVRSASPSTPYMTSMERDSQNVWRSTASLIMG